MAIKPICTKCIHNMGDGCEACVDNYLRIFDKGKCEDFNDGLLAPSSIDIIDEEDDYTREWD